MREKPKTMDEYLHTPGPDGKTPLEEAHDSTIALGTALLVTIVVIPLAIGGLLWWWLG